jgi:nicotinamide mononucleotide adenylyltransferase
VRALAYGAGGRELPFMSKRGSQLLEEALSLSASERAEMADQLLRSLEPPTQDEIDKLWVSEVEDRLEAFDRGDLRSASAARVFNSAKRSDS